MTSARFAKEASADPVGARRPGWSPPARATKPTQPHAPGLENAEWPRLELLIANFTRILDSEIALYYQLDGMGQLLPVISSWGLGPRHEPITRSHAGGIVGRALGAKRAALEPLDRDLALVDSGREVPRTHLAAATAPPTRARTRGSGTARGAVDDGPAWGRQHRTTLLEQERDVRAQRRAQRQRQRCNHRP